MRWYEPEPDLAEEQLLRLRKLRAGRVMVSCHWKWAKPLSACLSISLVKSCHRLQDARFLQVPGRKTPIPATDVIPVEHVLGPVFLQAHPTEAGS